MRNAELDQSLLTSSFRSAATEDGSAATRAGILRVGGVGLAGHQVKQVGNGGQFVGNLGLVGAEHGIALFIGGMITMHAADGPLAHVAGDDQHSLVDEKYQFSEI